MQEELVVLVDEKNRAVGTMPKATVHSARTPLHRAFSVLITNPEGKVLVQRRAHTKKTWPGIWSGSCCGHPAPQEPMRRAIMRRVNFELGIAELEDIREVLPAFLYRCERDGVVENEFCPVWMACTTQKPKINPNEVAEIKWLTWHDLLKDMKLNHDKWAEWLHLELAALQHDNFLI